MSKRIKNFMVDQLEGVLKESVEFIFIDVTGSSAVELDSLRVRLRSDNIRMQIIKNSVATRVFKALSKEEINQLIKGPCSVVYGGDDMVIMAKALDEWAKNNKPILLKGGYMTGLILTETDLKRLAKIPSRQQLLASVVGCIASPIRGFMNVLNGNLVNLVMVLKGIGEKKGETI